MKKDNKKCPVCEKGMLVPAEDIVSEIEGMIFIERGERCTHCNEEFIPEETGKKTIEIAKNANRAGRNARELNWL